MNAEPPAECRPQRHERRATRRALLCACAGVVGGLTIAIAAVLGGITMKQSIMLGVPAAVLTFGGLAWAVARDPGTAERQGFRAGFAFGSLRKRWRSLLGRQPKGRP